MPSLIRRPATFTEANAWVHLSPESFMLHFPYICTIWQTEEGRVWVETRDASGADNDDLAWWEQEAVRSGEPVLPCGCQVLVHFVPHAGKTICTFANPAIAFRTRLRLSGRLMLSAHCLSRVKEALYVHPHDEETVEQRLKGSVEND